MVIPDTLIISHQAVRKCFFVYRYITTLFCQRSFPFFGEGGCPVLTYTRDDLTEWAFAFSSQEELKRISENFYQSFLKEKTIDGFVQDVHTRHEEKITKFKQMKSLERLSSEELLLLYDEAIEHMGRTVRSMMIIRLGDLVNLQMVQSQIAADDDLTSLCAPTRKSYSLEEEIEFLRTDNITEHRKKWQWTSLGYFDERPVSLDAYRRRSQEMADKKSRAEALEREFEERVARQREIVSHYGSETQWLIYTIQESAALKDFLKRVFMEFRFYAQPIFQEIDRRWGVTCEYYTPQEVRLLMTQGVVVPKESIQKRHHICITYPTKDEIQIFYDRDAEEIEQHYFTLNRDTQSEWRGRVAQAGMGRGRVRVLLPGADVSGFRDGEVLVTNNTTPNFVPIMRRAAAIVAEEGGLTSHTAVVSRELGIPCVVGIPGMTQILKDGEMVEVDANQGTVRKL